MSLALALLTTGLVTFAATALGLSEIIRCRAWYLSPLLLAGWSVTTVLVYLASSV